MTLDEHHCTFACMDKTQSDPKKKTEKDDSSKKVWKRGANGGFVELDREDALEYLDALDSSKMKRDIQNAPLIPGVESVGFHPIPGQKMPENVAKDYVTMLGKMPTVENDGVVKDRQGKEMFRYPTVGKIVETARACTAKYNFAIHFPGGYEVRHSGRVVGMKMQLWHTSGHVHNCGSFVMPIEGTSGKAVCCAVSECRKYALGVALNMSWLDITEDAIQRRERGMNGNGHQAPSPQPQATQRTVTAPPKVETLPPPHHPTKAKAYDALKAQVRKTLENFKRLGASPTRVYFIATGRAAPENRFPATPSPCLLRAIIDLGEHVSSAYEEKDFPPDFDHEAFVELATRGCEPDEEVLFWRGGNRTHIGADFDGELLRPLQVKKQAPDVPDDDLPF